MVDFMEIPGRFVPEHDKLGWIQELLSMGRRFLETQPGWKDIEKAKELLSGAVDQRRAEGTSVVSVNFAQRFFKELVAQLTNIKPQWGYKAEDKAFAENEEVLNKCFKAWWPAIHGNVKIKEAMQMAGTGKGYISPGWNPNYRGFGKGEIELKVYGPKDVYPIMLPADGDIQKAFAVAIREEMPIHEAWAMWPSLKDKLRPTRGRATWMGTTGASNTFSRYASPVIRMLGLEKERRESENIFPTIDVYYIYIQDPSLNETGKKQALGTPNSAWYYEVPSMGSQLPTGARRATGQIDANGQPVYEEMTRAAQPDDCRMYPFRRLIIACETCVIKDDTSPYWHGQVPLVPFDIYKWTWEYISRPFPGTVMDLQSAYNDLLRTVVDSANLRLDPPLVFDQRSVSMQQMKTFTPRKPGGRLQMDLTYGQLVKPLMDLNAYDVPQWILTLMESLPQQMQKMCGINDMENVAKANQIPSDDTIDKMLDIQGPIVEDQAREMERALAKLGEMVKWLFFEFYNTTRRFQLLGMDGMTQEDFDFHPGLMIPDHMPGEDVKKDSKYSLAERAYRHAGNFIFHILPSSCYGITDMQRKLLYLQLFRTQYPIDPETVSEAIGLPNWGDLGDGTILEKYGRWMAIQAQMQVEIQGAMQQAAMAQQLGAMGQAAMAVGPQKPEGRPPSGQEAPKLEKKNGPDGPRPTITES